LVALTLLLSSLETFKALVIPNIVFFFLIFWGLIGNDHPKLNLTFIDDKTKHLQKKIPLYFFWGIFFLWVAMVWKFVTEKKQNNMILIHLPQEEILVMIILFIRETWTKLEIFPQDSLLIAPSPLESTFLFRYVYQLLQLSCQTTDVQHFFAEYLFI
jgi:hypothetical protein